MQTTRMHELIEKGYKENGLLDRIIFVYPSSQDISDWQLDEDSSFASFEKSSNLWEAIINKVIDLPFTNNDNVQNILEFEPSIKFKMMGWWIAE